MTGRLTDFGPVRHDEVATLGNDRVHSGVLQDLDDEVPLLLEVDGDRLEVALVRPESSQLKLEPSANKRARILGKVGTNTSPPAQCPSYFLDILETLQLAPELTFSWTRS